MTTVRVPANVDTADKVLFGLTVRQVVILAPVAVALIVAWKALDGVVPTVGLLIGCAPIAAAAVGLAMGRRDGTTVDRLAVAALRQPRTALAAGRVNATASLQVASSSSGPVKVGVLRGPVRAIDGDGVLDVGANGFAVGLDATTVNFALRSDEEQSILTAGFAKVLHSAPTGVQIVVSQVSGDVASHITRVKDATAQLRDPALAAAAQRYAAWLNSMTAATMVRRVVTVVVTAATTGAAVGSADVVATGCAAIGVRCTRLDAAALAARIRRGVDPFTAPAGERT